MKKRGQSTLEYAVVIAVVVGGLLAMQIYMKRGMQGKLRESADQIGEQYSAGHVTSKYTTEATNMLTHESFGLDEEGSQKKGVSYYEVINPASVTRMATGNDAEKITKKLNEEDLIEEKVKK